MHWLHQLTGFQLWVIAALLDVRFWQADRRWTLEHRAATVVSMVSLGIASLFFSIYWFVVAFIPVLSH